ncbi:MAG: uracil-DNA glycosylase [Bacteroidales bacterium]|nr:uracil-DNA glycosylase [Bacteroidales bacterium]MCF8344942.1 uracil-DNA glycosylase [Bacteroidales bacterium]MCF8351150.1 uracil-DNA glycosylase [Bacteroidales bacterium]MCF8376615.1 uracil-DNA glycosylase [Bacteroidales bacterium]MCF8400663.1 uracil-DNA glycosylase [Bacteroidales bacterium]
MAEVKPVIEESWGNVLKEEFNSEYFAKLKKFLIEEKSNYRIYPPGPQIFSAFNHTPFGRVKVVILGQDPYHGKGQAHGLCFSVPEGIRLPPSLQNIYKEIENDLGVKMPVKGTLTGWAKQGVLLLNATLTVRANIAGSHQNNGWEEFTDAAIRQLSAKRTGLVFLLWGNYARAKEQLIDHTKHHILKAPHPSPFSANRGFFGCGHFSKTNDILKNQGKEMIYWENL